MKKIFFIAAALLVSVNSFAQFGIIAGLTSSSTSLKSARLELESKTVAQYHVGITYKLAAGDFLAVQPSLIYNVKGAKLAEFNAESLDFKTGYIEVPVQLQVGFGIASLARVYGIVEPFVGYAVTNRFEGVDLKDKWGNVSNKFEYGVGLGAGVEVFSHLQLSIRYFWNLGNVYDFSWGAFQNVTKSKSAGITASAAFLF